jgi:hypothetical protein
MAKSFGHITILGTSSRGGEAFYFLKHLVKDEFLEVCSFRSEHISRVL